MERQEYPKGISLEDIKIYRFHSKRRLNLSSSGFFQTFLDCEHSAKKAGRFCASYINPGFFFGLTPETSLFEFLFYNQQYGAALRSRTMEECIKTILSRSKESPAFVTCRVSLDNILDLCDPSTIRAVMEDCFSNWVERERLRNLHTFDAFLAFASSPKYGDILTDVIGEYAWKRGFNGIKFLSVRAIDVRESPTYLFPTFREHLHIGVAGDDGGVQDEMVREASEKMANIIIFRGSYLAQRIRSFRIRKKSWAKGVWRKNDVWQKEIQFIERSMVENGGITQEQMEELCCHILRLTHFEIVTARNMLPDSYL